MQIRWPTSRISPVFCDVWPTIADLAGDVRPGNRLAERVPAPHLPALAGERLLRMVAAVDKEMRVRFPVVAPGANEVDVRRRDTADRRHRARAVRIHRGLPAAEEPIVRLRRGRRDS